MGDAVLTEALIRRCPTFAFVFGRLIQDNNIEQLYKDNYYFLDSITNYYDCDFDTTILEIIVKDIYSSTSPFSSLFSASEKKRKEKINS